MKVLIVYYSVYGHIHKMAEAVAEVGGIQVGAVEARCEAPICTVALDLGAGNFQERTDDADRLVGWLASWLVGWFAGWLVEGGEHSVVRDGGQGEHAAQPCWPGPAQEVHQHGLRLVVGVVTDRDSARADLGGDSRQECVAHAPGRLLEG